MSIVPDPSGPSVESNLEADAALSGPTRVQRVLDSDIWFSFKSSPITIVSAVVAVAFILVALLAPLVAPHNPFDPSTINLMNGSTPPMTANEFTGESFLFGTDNQGRDVLSAIFYGSRISLFVAFAAIAMAVVIGVALGLISGYVGGWVDAVIMRVADVQLSFPSILLALLISGIMRGILPADLRDEFAIFTLIIAIGLSDWVQFARVVRGSTMVEKNKEYVQAARVMGLPPVLTMIRHVLPNVMAPVLVISTISLALAIIAEATLSFLGVGAPPTEPSLGTLIRQGQNFLFSGEWWITIFPGIALVLLALSINLLGDWLRDALNPKLR